MVSGLHQAHQHQQIKYDLAQIAPHLRHYGGTAIHHRRTAGGKGRKDDAGQNDHRTLHAYAHIAPQKRLAEMGSPLSGKGCQCHRGQRGVHIDLKKAPIDGEDHNEGQHRNK